MRVFFDEAGDAGWSLDQPYRQGGSSRYLTLAFLITPKDSWKYARRLVADYRTKYRFSAGRELKGKDLTPGQCLYFAEQARGMILAHPEIELRAMTTCKKNVAAHIRRDPNKLYNYMIKLCLLDRLENEAEVTLVPDERSIKVASGNSMVDYLQTEMWFERSSTTRLLHRPRESHTSPEIQFVDVVTHIIWSHHEDGQSEAYRVLGPYAGCHTLYFDR